MKTTLLLIWSLLLLSLNLFPEKVDAQVKITPGGVVKLGMPQNNQTNYVLVGTNTRLADCKFTIDAFDKTGLGIYVNHNFAYGWALLQYVTNSLTKCNIVSYNGSHTFYVYGNGNAYGLNFISTSDKRLKTNLKEIESPMDKVKKLTGYTYQWDQNYVRPSVKLRGGGNLKDTTTYVGLLAQDVYDVLPEAVFFDEDSLMGLNYPCLVALLVNAMKEQQQQIDSLKQTHQKILSVVKGKTRKDVQVGDSLLELITPTETLQPGMVLYQNQPNPFQKETTIKIYSADGISNGQLLITNLNGELITSYKVNGKGDFQLVVEAAALKPGIYLYTLVVDNKEVATRKMILTQ